MIEKELVDLGLLTLRQIRKQDPDHPARRPPNGRTLIGNERSARKFRSVVRPTGIPCP